MSQPVIPPPVDRPETDQPETDRPNRDEAPRRQRRRARPAKDAPLAHIVTSRLEQRLMYGLLIVMAVIWSFPLYAAIRESLEVNGFQNYVSLFTDPIADISIPRTYLNSFIVGIIHAVVVVAVSTCAGYAFSKLAWRGREPAFAASLLFLAIPPAAMIVPFYQLNNGLGLFNSYLGVGLPEAAITIPFGVLLLRNFGRNVPDSLIEAATIDGAGHVAVFRHIFLPLTRPAIVNLTILSFVWSLQDFMWPSIFIRDTSLVTAAQAVLNLNTGLGAAPADIARFNASLVVLAIPAVLVVLIGMRFIINGLTAGSEKG